jgi:SAM-dependent methyltransferase
VWGVPLSHLRGGGAFYALLQLVRSLLRAVLPAQGQVASRALPARAVRRSLALVEARLAAIERRRSIVAPWAAVSSRFTVGDNRRWWDSHDWSRLGEEWTPSADWKAAILQRFLMPYMPESKTLLEIGPGAGRWTEALQSRAAVLYVVDVSEKALAVCRERFAGRSNVVFLLGSGSTIAVPDASVDGIWAYDVFVHVNPSDTQSYFREFWRVLRPGAFAVVHHPGRARSADRQAAHRSDLTDEMVRRFSRETGLELVLQTEDLVNPGDVLTVVRRPA